MKSFKECNLIAPVQRALAEVDYVSPTPIQSQTIPAAMSGRDILGCAQTGTGKTAAFSLPILDRLGKNNRRAIPNQPVALVMAPTRELAIQIERSLATYGKHLRLHQALVYGGVSQVNQVRKMNRGAHILVATPGRLLDLLNQGHIRLNQLEVFVLDEVDRMLDMGFLPDLKRIISHLPKQRQSLFFSATLPPDIRQLAKCLLRDPVSVNVTPETPSVKKIDQQFLFVDNHKKQAVLHDIVSASDVQRALVFSRTKRGANRITEKLLRSGISATAIHGNKSQSARQKALAAFRSKRASVLVATDVAARGIDVAGITHVVNFDLPVEPENYIHRIGRTGRAGASGIAISLCSPGERSELRAIEKFVGRTFQQTDDTARPKPAARPSGRARPTRSGKPANRSTRSRRTRRMDGNSSEHEVRTTARRRPRSKPKTGSRSR